MNKNEVNYKVLVSCMTFNQSRYIVDAMNGFCMQKTDFPFICVIMDDASTDGEQEVIEKYLEEHFDIDNRDSYYNTETDYAHVVFARHTSNRNCYFLVYYLKENHYSQKKDKKAYLKDIQSKIEYIALCEGDDYWTDSSKLQKQADFLDKNIDCSCCVHDYDEYIQNEHQFRPHTLICLTDFKGIGIKKSLAEYATGVFFTKTLTVVYRKVALERSNYYQYKSRFDMTMFFALATQGYIYVINQRMAVYRINDGGVSSSKNLTTFQKRIIPGLYSVCMIEKSDESKKFVYTYIRGCLLTVILSQPQTLYQCIPYIGLCYGLKLWGHDVVLLGMKMIMHKINKIKNINKCTSI